MDTENRNNLFNFREIIYLLYNGMATGQIIHGSKDLIQNGYDKDKFIILLMWILMFAFSAERLYHAYKSNKDNQENQNNLKQR